MEYEVTSIKKQRTLTVDADDPRSAVEMVASVLNEVSNALLVQDIFEVKWNVRYLNRGICEDPIWDGLLTVAPLEEVFDSELFYQTKGGVFNGPPSVKVEMY